MRRTARDTEESARRITRRSLMMGGAMVAMFAVLGARMRFALAPSYAALASMGGPCSAAVCGVPRPGRIALCVARRVE